MQRTISKFLDHDLASGLVVRVTGLVARDGIIAARVVDCEGRTLLYFDADTVFNTGEIARQIEA